MEPTGTGRDDLGMGQADRDRCSDRDGRCCSGSRVAHCSLLGRVSWWSQPRLRHLRRQLWGFSPHPVQILSAAAAVRRRRRCSASLLAAKALHVLKDWNQQTWTAFLFWISTR